MTKNTNERLYVSKNAVFIFHNGKVVTFNNAYGQWIRFSSECYSYLNKAVSLKMNEEEFISCFEDDGDKKYIKKLISQLKDIKVLNESVRKKEIDNISVLVTERCNLFCTHCAANSKKMNEISDVSTKDMLQTLNKVIECNPKSITISGGEPLVRKDFKELVSYIVKKNSTIDIDLMTNATLITEDSAKFIAENVDVVDISMDGYDEKSCSLIRGKGVFNKIIAGIKLLQKPD